jgi:nucleotide-binding universal stress UspA family protein
LTLFSLLTLSNLIAYEKQFFKPKQGEMQQFNRTMVALDLSLMDEKLLRYVAFIAPLIDIHKIYFLHAIPDFTAPENVDVEFQKLFAPEYPVDEKVRDKIASEVQEVFDGSAIADMGIEVVEGKPYDQLLHWAEVKEIDLLVVGHKNVSEGSGITPRRVARHSDCNLLFVPDESEPALRHVTVPVDFSENSRRALEAALLFKQRRPESSIQCVYVVDLPPADYYIRPFQETGYRRILMESAQNAYRDFISESGFDPTLLKEAEFIPNEYSNIAQHLSEYTDQHPTDLVIMGAQGHSALERFIFGSVTEKFLERCKDKPILVVR